MIRHWYPASLAAWRSMCRSRNTRRRPGPKGFPAQSLVRVQVNQKGRVVLARSSRGDWRLRAAAVKAAQKATFSPEKLAVRGKVVSGTITYNFVAQTESPAATGSQVSTGSPVRRKRIRRPRPNRRPQPDHLRRTQVEMTQWSAVRSLAQRAICLSRLTPKTLRAEGSTAQSR